jgi:hypothetical protein
MTQVNIICLIVLLCFGDYTLQKKRYRIKLVEYNFMFVPQKRCTDSIKEILPDGRLLKIKLFDCKGKLSLECYNSRLVLLEEGEYVNSLDLLKSYYYVVDAERRATGIGVSEFYQPLRDGVWRFYNDSGKITWNVIYKNGVLIDSIPAR